MENKFSLHLFRNAHYVVTKSIKHVAFIARSGKLKSNKSPRATNRQRKLFIFICFPFLVRLKKTKTNSFLHNQRKLCRHLRQRNLKRSCHLPHQIVKYKSQNVGENSLGAKGGSRFTVVPTNLADDESKSMLTNLLKKNFLDQPVSLDQNQLASTDTHTQNLILSDQFSQSTTLAAKNRVDCLPAGLAVAAALNINLSSLGPLYSRARTNTSSSTRASRATSPSLGNADNRLIKIGLKFILFTFYLSCVSIGLFEIKHIFIALFTT